MKILLIGLGQMGQFHLNNLLKISEVKKIYAFDISEDAFKIKNNKITYSTNLEDFENLNYDFVDIVAPTKFHYFYLEKFIKLHKNIFVEKPIVSSVEEMLQLDKLVKDVGYKGKIAVGFIERFNPVVKFLKQKINELGIPKLVEIFRYNPTSDRIRDTDVVTDLMIHDIDLINYFLGNNTNITGKNIQKDNATVLFRNHGANITLAANRITQQKIRKIKVYYNNLTIDGDLIIAKVEMYHKPQKYLTTKGQDLSISYLIEEKLFMKTNQLLEELQEFINIVKGGEFKLLADYESGKKSIYLVHQIVQDV